MNKKTPNSSPTNDSSRCQPAQAGQHRTATNRRCRLPVTDTRSRLCFRHPQLQQQKRDAADLVGQLARRLLCGAQRLLCGRRRTRKGEEFDMIFADLRLSQRIEAAEAQSGVDCATTMAHLRPESGAGAEPVAGGSAIFAGVNSPVTQAVGVGLHGPVSEAEIEQLEQFYRSRGDAVRVELSPHAHPSLFEHFGRRGYRTVEVSNVLVRPLRRAETWPFATAGITVERVRSEDAALWTRTVAQGFAEHFPVSAEILEVMELFFYSPKAQCFLARLDGEPAGGAALAVHDEIAGIYGASTLPAFRKRGVQTALLHARLTVAVAAGCDLAHTITQVGSGSQRNVERCDFRVVYTRSKFQRDWTT